MTTMENKTSALLPEIKGPLPGPKAKEIVDRDKHVMSPSYTRDYPFVMDRGEGCLVWDVDGNRFLDVAAGIAVCATGHSHPHVVKAITDQASKFLHMSGTDFYYEVQVRLAERLFKYAPIPGEKKVFFTNSGAEAAENALKVARGATGKRAIVAFDGGFHGRTLATLNLNGNSPSYTGTLTLSQGRLNAGGATFGGSLVTADNTTTGGEATFAGNVTLGSATGTGLVMDAATPAKLTAGGAMTVNGTVNVTVSGYPVDGTPIPVSIVYSMMPPR